jgi:hypothetical protein
MVKPFSTYFLVVSAAAAVTTWAARGISVAAQAAATTRPDLTGQCQPSADQISVEQVRLSTKM